MNIICNSSIIIILSELGKLEILWKLFDGIFVPIAVYNEVCVNGAGRPGSSELKRALDERKAILVQVKNKLLVESLYNPLGRGEAEVIVSAVETNADIVGLDDKIARNKARQFGLNVIGTLGILGLALKNKIISEREFLSLIARLRKTDFRISNYIIKEFLKKMEEK